MWITKKKTSFTLSEMLVVLVITSIIITLSLTVLSLFQKQSFNAQNTYKHNNEIMLFENAFWKDIHHNNALFFDPQKQQLLFENSNKTVAYTFYKNFLLRNQDTLNIAFVSIQPFLHTNKVPSGPIDAIELSLDDHFQNKKLFFYKKNNTSFYMNTVWHSN